MKRALVSGITGQDGSYLAELLLEKGYEVHGLVRRVSVGNTWRIDHILDRLVLHDGDLTERSAVARLIKKSEPDFVFNLAAMSFVKTSFEIPEYTFETNALAVVRLLEEIRNSGRPIRFYQASTSEMFGISPPPQNEQTPFYPRSPYGCAKAFAHWFCVNMRESYDMHISCGILHNHESPRRGEEFVTRKIARAAARIALGLEKEVRLGNVDARRDWGHAKDFVEAMYLMVQQDKPDDYVVATGETHSVAEFSDAAFTHVGLDWKEFVKTDPRYFRPAEVHDLCGDASKARRVLGWTPKTTFKQLVIEMVDAELAALKDAGRRSMTVTAA